MKRRAELPQGSFIFILSDFLADVPAGTWSALGSAHWDVVPVVVQDPVWEQSFPDVPGVLVPFASPDGSEDGLVRLEAGEVSLRRRENEYRLARLLRLFRRAGSTRSCSGRRARRRSTPRSSAGPSGAGCAAAGDEHPRRSRGDRVVLTPGPTHFGDLVRVEVHGQAPSFVPFAVREHHGSTYVLQCLDPACSPAPGRRPCGSATPRS